MDTSRIIDLLEDVGGYLSASDAPDTQEPLKKVCQVIEALKARPHASGGTGVLPTGDYVGWSITEKDGEFISFAGLMTVVSPAYHTERLDEAELALRVALDNVTEAARERAP